MPVTALTFRRRPARPATPGRARIRRVSSFTLAIGAAVMLGVMSCGDSTGPGDPEPSRLGIVRQPSATARNGVALAVQPIVQLVDANGQPVERAGVVVTASIASGGGTLGGVLTRSTDETGTVAFTNLVITGTAGPRTLSFSAIGLTSVSSGAIALGAGQASAAHSTIEAGALTLPVNGTATTSIVVQLRDASGNVLSSGAGYTLALATTAGTLSAPTDLGDGTFLAELTAPTTIGAGTAVVTGTLDGAAIADQATIDLVPGPVHHFVVEAEAGGPIGVQARFVSFPVRIVALDATGNTVTNFLGTVEVTSTGTLAQGGGTSGAFAAGVLSGHRLNFSSEGTFTVTVTRTGGTQTGTSAPIVVDAAPTVVATTPADGATGVSTVAALSVTFSEPVTAGAGAFSLACPAGTARAVTVTAASSTVYSLVPVSALPGGTQCRLTIAATGIADADANDGPDAMLADHVVTFSTPTLVAADDDWAVDASRHVTGNVRFRSGNAAVPFGVTSNDQLEPGAVVSFAGWMTPLVTSAGRTERGGNVSVTPTGAGMGQFTYDPPAGYEGQDRFQYVVAHNGVADTATVTLTVSGVIWFVDHAAPGCTTVANGCGRLTSPYSSLAAFQAENSGTGSRPAVGDAVFLAQSASPYTGGVTLLAGQRLVGQDATIPLAAAAGVTLASGSDALPAMQPDDAVRTTIGGASGVVLGADNTLRGLSIRTTAGTALRGIAIGTLRVSEDVRVHGDARALELSGIAIAGSFGQVRADGTGADDQGVEIVVEGTQDLVTLGTASDYVAGLELAGGAGRFAIPSTVGPGAFGPTVHVNSLFRGDALFTGSITRGARPSVIAIEGNGASEVVFSGGSKQVNQLWLSNNSSASSIAFVGGGLDIAGDVGEAALFAQQGGTLTVTGNDNVIVASGTTGAVRMRQTAFGASGATFRSVTATGADTALLIADAYTGSIAGALTGGHFTITGSGASDRSNTTRGRVTARAATDATGSGPLVLGSGGTLAGNVPVHLVNAGRVVLQNVVVQNGANLGIEAAGATPLGLDNASISGAGVVVRSGASLSAWHTEITGSFGSAIDLRELGGASAVHHMVLAGGGISAVQSSGALQLTVDNASIQASGSWCIGVDGGWNQVGPTVAQVTVIRSDLFCQTGIDFLSRPNVIDASLTVDGNNFRNASQEIRATFDQPGTAALTLRNNVIRSTGSYSSPSITLAGSGSTVLGSIIGNSIGNASVANSGGTSGISVDGTAAWRLALSANTIVQTSAHAVSLQPSGTFDLTARGNILRVNPATTTSPAAAVRYYSAAGTHCLDLRDNVEIRGRTNGVVFQAAAGAPSPTVRIAGYGGAANSAAELQAYLSSTALAPTNTPTASVGIVPTASVSGTAACQSP